jgi:ribosomal protein S18 acetylase RimI-like enzyme
MRLHPCSILFSVLCIFGQLHADWLVTGKDGSQITLSICKDNLDKEREVFNKSFTQAYKGTDIEKMVLEQYKTLEDFLSLIFDGEDKDFRDHKKDTLFISAKNNDGNIIGYVAFDKNPDHVYIRPLAVDPEFQHSGIGYWLMWSFLNTWKDCTSVKLETRKLNFRAIAFYKKLGFDFSQTHGPHDPNVYVELERTIDQSFITSMVKKYERIN